MRYPRCCFLEVSTMEIGYLICKFPQAQSKRKTEVINRTGRTASWITLEQYFSKENECWHSILQKMSSKRQETSKCYFLVVVCVVHDKWIFPAHVSRVIILLVHVQSMWFLATKFLTMRHKCIPFVLSHPSLSLQSSTLNSKQNRHFITNLHESITVFPFFLWRLKIRGQKNRN